MLASDLIVAAISLKRAIVVGSSQIPVTFRLLTGPPGVDEGKNGAEPGCPPGPIFVGRSSKIWSSATNSEIEKRGRSARSSWLSGYEKMYIR